MHKAWSKGDNHNKLFQDKEKTKRMFHSMVQNKKFPSAVIGQYICAIKYADKRQIEILARGGITQDIINMHGMDDDDIVGV